MIRQFFRKVKKGLKRKHREIDPEDIFLDSKNLPGFNQDHFEGKIERPVGDRTFFSTKVVFLIIVLFFAFKLWNLEINKGEAYTKISENNRLEHSLIFANRGVIYDRNGLALATNAVHGDESDFAKRVYADIAGISHVVGYLKYPTKDSSGFYYEENYRGRDGVESTYNELLSGTNGLKIKETDALGKMVSESVVQKPEDGKPLTLSIDANLSQALYKAIENVASDQGFSGGGGVIMDVNTGEVLALTSYPEYDENVVTSGDKSSLITKLFTDPGKPFLNRVTGGLYAPGSIVKPMVALGALNEGVITPEKKILSTGSISIPNPYDKTKFSIFKDWRPQGWVNMRDALAVSSDVYFYEVGGGFEDQAGLGIGNLDKYFNLFGFAEDTGIDLPGESSGLVPSPEWKAKTFNGDAWRVGDTYITAIGQYGTQVTPIEMVRAVGAVANGGKLLVPTVVKGNGDKVFRSFNFPSDYLKVVQEGMRQAVLPGGTASGLDTGVVDVAAKTGTAEIGITKILVNSWSTGFFPYKNPKYAFAVIMERGPSQNTIGATAVMHNLLGWMSANTPDYLK